MFKQRKPLSVGAFWIITCLGVSVWIVFWGWIV